MTKNLYPEQLKLCKSGALASGRPALAAATSLRKHSNVKTNRVSRTDVPQALNLLPTYCATATSHSVLSICYEEHCARSVKLKNHLHLLPRLKKHGTLLPLPEKSLRSSSLAQRKFNFSYIWRGVISAARLHDTGLYEDISTMKWKSLRIVEASISGTRVVFGSYSVRTSVGRRII